MFIADGNKDQLFTAKAPERFADMFIECVIRLDNGEIFVRGIG